MKRNMIYNFLFIFCMLFISTGVFAENVIGVVDLAIGKIILFREGEELKPKRGMEVELQDRITSAKNARFTIRLLDGNKIKVPEGEELPVEDIIVQALSGRSSSAFKAFKAFLEKLAKDKDYDSVMIGTMGARGIMDETSIKKSIREIDRILLAEEDPALVLDLLLMKADLYLELGNYRQAKIIYEELKNRDKEKKKAEEINGLLAILTALGNKKICIDPFICENPELSRLVHNILCTDLSKSGMLLVSEKKDETKHGSGIQYLLTGNILYKDTDISIAAQLTALQCGEVMGVWSIPGHKDTIDFFTQQLAGLVHHAITGKDIPAQNITRYIDELEGIEPLDEVDVYLGLNKDGVLPAYKIEEELVIHFALNGNKDKMYYMTIMSIGPDGEVNQLFPSSFNSANKIKNNTHYTLPEANAEYTFSVYGSPGKNYVVGIVTEHPLTLADTKKTKEEIFPVLSSNPEEYLGKGLQVCAAKSNIKKWRIGVIHFMALGE
ncbi:MAG: DUF4384 domain-containing protein [Spirochaetales bacterium]|nr:DUF4384 domain-containing protein [Spirochaetales bacterium]